MTALAETPTLAKGLSVGAVYVLMEVSQRLSITKSLGNTREGKLALWQVFARVIAQGSRLSAVRLAAQHAVFDLLKLETFTEDDLYDITAMPKEIKTRTVILVITETKNMVKGRL